MNTAYLFAGLVVYIGYFIGWIIYHYTQKEVHAGRKNLVMTQYALLLFYILLIIYYKATIFSVIGTAFVFLLATYISYRRGTMRAMHPIWLSLTVAFGLIIASTFAAEQFFPVALLGFLLNIPTGSLVCDIHYHLRYSAPAIGFVVYAIGIFFV